MKERLFFGGLLLAAIFITWLLWPVLPCVSLADVRQPETIVLGEKTGNPHTTVGVTILGSGEIDGEATTLFATRW
jgi:hypothetical protein